MIGTMLQKIRKDKNISQSELAKKTKINLGHLMHIEQEERHPSYNTLKNICSLIDTPYFLLMSIFDKDITSTYKKYDVCNHINYDKLICVNSDFSLINCPDGLYNASFALIIKDNSMEPELIKNHKAFIELGCPLDNKEIGLFLVNNKIIIRKFLVKTNSITLRPLDQNYEDIVLTKKDNFKIIGKVIGSE